MNHEVICSARQFTFFSSLVSSSAVQDRVQFLTIRAHLCMHSTVRLTVSLCIHSFCLFHCHSSSLIISFHLDFHPLWYGSVVWRITKLAVIVQTCNAQFMTSFPINISFCGDSDCKRIRISCVHCVVAAPKSRPTPLLYLLAHQRLSTDALSARPCGQNASA